MEKSIGITARKGNNGTFEKSARNVHATKRLEPISNSGVLKATRRNSVASSVTANFTLNGKLERSTWIFLNSRCKLNITVARQIRVSFGKFHLRWLNDQRNFPKNFFTFSALTLMSITQILLLKIEDLKISSYPRIESFPSNPIGLLLSIQNFEIAIFLIMENLLSTIFVQT